jgi:pimeloyl-ACP methyl ester carboxylesterase
MEDDQIEEIFAFARDAFRGGQTGFQVQALPFRMTAANMARYRDDPNYEFWKMLKEGYDHFEITRVPPQVNVCDRRYVFNRFPENGESFNSTAACPPTIQPEALQTAYSSFQSRYEAAFGAAMERLDRKDPPSPSITGLKEAAEVADWSRHLRVHAVDLVGEPGLSAPSRPALDSGDVALWLDDVMAGLGLSRAAFVGMSLGGWTALDHAVRRPGRVERLALVCPGGIGRQTPLRLAPALAWSPFGRWGRLRSVRAVLGLRGPGHAPLVQDVAATFGEFRPRTETLPVFSDADLRGLDMPVLAVMGAKDVMIEDTPRIGRAVRSPPQPTSQ